MFFFVLLFTSGLGSPTTSQTTTSESPSTTSVERGFCTKRGASDASALRVWVVK